ncbi:MAG: sialidase family protein [Chitinophagaceae bacterium]
MILQLFQRIRCKLHYCIWLPSFLLLLSCQKEFSIDSGVMPVVPTPPRVDTNKPILVFDSTQFNLFDSTSGIPQTEAFDGEFLVKQANNPAFLNRKYQGVPSIGIDRNNNLYVAWMSGGTDEQPGNYLMFAVSVDRGITWRQSELIINPKKSNVRYFDVCFFKDKYNNLYVSWSKCTGTGIWDGTGGVWYTKISYVNDTVRTQKPFRIANGVMMNKPITTNDGKSVLFPISHWLWPSFSFINQKVNVFKGNYGIKKLENYASISYIPISNIIRSQADEHQIVQLSDTSYLALIRTRQGIYFTNSKDAINWTPCQKFTAIGNTTEARSHISRLKSGKIALVVNNSLTRNDLKIFLSNDNGKTWPHKLLIDNRAKVSYPDLVQDENGTIYIIYDFDRYGIGSINLVALTESDIINNNLASIKRVIINKL